MINTNTIDRYASYYCGIGRQFASKKEYAGYVACLDKLKLGDQLECYFDPNAYGGDGGDGTLQTIRGNTTVVCDIIGRCIDNPTQLLLGRTTHTGTMWNLVNEGLPNMDLVDNWQDYKFGWWLFDIHMIDCVLAKSAIKKNR